MPDPTPMPVLNLLDLAAGLRKIAADIEAGDLQGARNVAVVIEMPDRREVAAFGPVGHPLYVAGLLYGGAQDLVGLDPSRD